MIKGDEITRDRLIEHLSRGFCKVQFRKQTDGRFRSMVCTLNPKEIPGKHAKGIEKSIDGSDNPNVLPVFDVVARDWRSFHIPNVLYFYTEDEMRGNRSNQSEEKGVNNAKRTTDRRKAKAPKAKRPNKEK